MFMAIYRLKKRERKESIMFIIATGKSILGIEKEDIAFQYHNYSKYL